MAKQKGTVILSGKLGGIVFYTNRYGNQARMHETVSKEKYLRSKSTERRRQTASEFGYAARTGKLLRHAVLRCLPRVKEGSLNSRLAGFIMGMTREDKTGKRGQKRITADNIQLLKGFNWMEGPTVSDIVRTGAKVTLDAVDGVASLRIARLVPSQDLQASATTTHVEISLVLVSVNYEKDNYTTASAVSGKLDVRSDADTALELTCSLPAFKWELLVAGIGVQGYRLRDGQFEPVEEKMGFEVREAQVIS